MSEVLRPVVRALLGTSDPSITIRFWDGSELGPSPAKATVVVGSPMALRRLLWSPNELGVGRAYVAGDIDIEGDIYEALDIRKLLAAKDEHAKVGLGLRGWLDTAQAARQLGVLGPPPPRPREEAQLHGRLHTRSRDSAAISHHYDVSNDFYRLVLGQTMTYSCAYFERDDVSLDEAQEAKYEHICRKLGLRPGMRLLDVGCGWGGMVRYAARQGVKTIGVTLSKEQAAWAQHAIEQEGLAELGEVRHGDYRDILETGFDAVSSIGLTEHIGVANYPAYFGFLKSKVRTGGLLLNHCITRHDNRHAANAGGFIDRYVFPDGELTGSGRIITEMQDAGFEVLHEENLRHHYALTLRDWCANLVAHWDEAVEEVGLGTAKVWGLYMAASRIGFEHNAIQLHQALGVKLDKNGNDGGLPLRPWWTP